MQKGQRFRFVAIVGLVVALTTAGFALAGGNTFDTSEEPQPTVCPPNGGTVDEGDSTDETTEDGGTVEDGGTFDEGDTTETGDTVDEGDATEDGDVPEDGDTTEDGDTVDEGDQGDPAECEDPADEADDSDDAEAPADGATDQPATDASPERIAECTEAAGLTAAPTEKPVAGELKGLENAISHVLWNCMRNDNDGLVNALEHLSANLEAKQLRDEAKAERKAAHDAAKAAREAAHAAAKAARELSHSS
jgi:hypothetical protein